MTVIESHSTNQLPVVRSAAIVVLIAGGFFLPRLLGGTSVAYSTLTTIAIFAVMCYGVDVVLSYLGEVVSAIRCSGRSEVTSLVKYGLNG
jgi:branched-chain amino acid transport system permease protein